MVYFFIAFTEIRKEGSYWQVHWFGSNAGLKCSKKHLPYSIHVFITSLICEIAGMHLKFISSDTHEWLFQTKCIISLTNLQVYHSHQIANSSIVLHYLLDTTSLITRPCRNSCQKNRKCNWHRIVPHQTTPGKILYRTEGKKPNSSPTEA